MPRVGVRVRCFIMISEIEDLIFVYFLINIPNCLINYVATLYIEVVLRVRYV